MPKSVHVVLSNKEHQFLKELKEKGGLTWREVLYKAFDVEPPEEE